MSVFLDTIFAFPTAIFTGLLIVSLLYWGFVIIGALDIDMLHPGAHLDGATEGAIHGAKEAVFEGIAEGATEGAAEGAIHGAKEAVFEGLADGATEGAAEGAMHGVKEGLAEAASSAKDVGEGLSLLNFLGLRKAPMTVTMSILVLGAWVLSYLGMRLLAPAMDSVLPHWVSAMAVMIGSMAGAIPIASFATMPMAPLFRTVKEDSRADLYGLSCVLTTGHVDGGFGQALVGKGGSQRLVQIRCDKENDLEKGDEALIIAFDSTRNAFRVEPLTAKKRDEQGNKTHAPDERTKAAVQSQGRKEAH